MFLLSTFDYIICISSLLLIIPHISATVLILDTREEYPAFVRSFLVGNVDPFSKDGPADEDG